MKMKSKIKCLWPIFLILLFSLCSCDEKSISSERFCFGTSCKVTLYGKVDNPDMVFEGLWSLMSDLENRISCKLKYSTVSKMNRGEQVAEDADISALLAVGQRFKELTGGRFDVEIGAVSDLWAVGTENARVPSEDEIASALCSEKLDFGALGKGYASDLARKWLLECNVKSAIINFGGNICCVGNKNGKPFSIGIQNPDGQRGTYSQVVQVENACVVTSGAYERFFEQDGVVYSHIMDALTGSPVNTDVKSVSVIGPEGVICDALSTCCYILGQDGSSALLEQFKDYSVLFL